MARRKDRVENELQDGSLSHNPFAALRGDAGEDPAGRPGAPVQRGATPTGGARDEGARRGGGAAPASRLVVRFEARGHGGKPVTRVQGLPLESTQLEALARDLRRGLGAGARVEGADLVVQGRQQDRVIAWLAEHGHPGAARGN